MTSKYLIPLLTSSILVGSISPVWGQENTTPKINFSCENNNGVLITWARNNEGKTQTIFHWKEEILKDKTTKTPQELFNDVSLKLNDLSASDRDLSSFILVPETQSGLPLVCVSTLNIRFTCTKLIFTFLPHKNEHPIDEAKNVLMIFINPNVSKLVINRNSHRANHGYYSVNLFQNKE